MLLFVRRALTGSCLFAATLMGLSFYAEDFLSILIYLVVLLMLFRLRRIVSRKLWARRRFVRGVGASGATGGAAMLGTAARGAVEPLGPKQTRWDEAIS